MALKVVIGTKDGKSLQKEIEDTKPLFGKKIGETLKGEVIDLPGYEFLITGGSDVIGFPMRKDMEGTKRGKILAVSGIGLKPQRKGQRTRKTVAGGTVGAQTAQLNVTVAKEGKNSLFETPVEEASEQTETPSEDKK
jgi:ribosomal protein S6E (S10)